MRNNTEKKKTVYGKRETMPMFIEKCSSEPVWKFKC